MAGESIRAFSSQILLLGILFKRNKRCEETEFFGLIRFHCAAMTGEDRSIHL